MVTELTHNALQDHALESKMTVSHDFGNRAFATDLDLDLGEARRARLCCLQFTC